MAISSGRAWTAGIWAAGIIALVGCGASSSLEPDGTIKSQEGYNIMREPGQSDRDFVAQYRYCLTAESERKFPTVCMQDHGSSLRLSNGHIMASTQKKTRNSRIGMCRNFASEFTLPIEAFNQCMSRLGEAVTAADGRVIPPHSIFQTPLTVKSDALAALAAQRAKPPVPTTEAASQSSDSGAGLALLGLLLAASRQSGGSSTAAQRAPDEPNPFGGMIVNYGMCGNMWGC